MITVLFYSLITKCIICTQLIFNVIILSEKNWELQLNLKFCFVFQIFGRNITLKKTDGSGVIYLALEGRWNRILYYKPQWWCALPHTAPQYCLRSHCILLTNSTLWIIYWNHWWTLKLSVCKYFKYLSFILVFRHFKYQLYIA